MPRAVADRLIEPVTLPTRHHQRAVAEGRAAETDAQSVAAAGRASVAVDAAVVELPAVEHFVQPVAGQIALVQPNLVPPVVERRQPAVNEIAVDLLRSDLARQVGKPPPVAVAATDRDAQPQRAAPVGRQQGSPRTQWKLHHGPPATGLDGAAPVARQVGVPGHAGLVDAQARRGDVRRERHAVEVGEDPRRTRHHRGGGTGSGEPWSQTRRDHDEGDDDQPAGPQREVPHRGRHDSLNRR